jgi:hypothetical protein
MNKQVEEFRMIPHIHSTIFNQRRAVASSRQFSANEVGLLNDC